MELNFAVKMLNIRDANLYESYRFSIGPINRYFVKKMANVSHVHLCHGINENLLL
jgi:hypothetical protein